MRKIALLCLLVVGVFLFDLSVWAWGTDVLVFDGPVTCFDADYSSDGTMYVVFQRADPDWPICYASSSDHGRIWEYHGSVVNVGHRLERIRALVGEYQDWPALYVFYVHLGLPTMTRFLLGGSLAFESVTIRPLVSHVYDFDVAMASEVSGPGEDSAGFPGDHSSELPILFAFRRHDATLIHFFRSRDGGTTWEEVHTIDDVRTYGRSVGLALVWGPPSTFFYVWKRLDPDLSGCDDPIEDDHCYTAYWGENRLNGDPSGYWREGWVIQPAVYYEDGDYCAWAEIPNDYYDPQLAMSFDTSQPTIWSVFNEQRITQHFVYTEETGWETGPEATGIPDKYVSDVEPYRALGNPNINYVDARRNEDGDAPNNCIMWSWSQVNREHLWRTARHWSYEDRCINDHDTNIMTPGFGSQLIYSPGSEIGGAGIVYLGFTMDDGPPEPGLYFDAPWFHRVIRFDSLAEPCSSFMTLDSEPSEHPMTYVPEPGSRSISSDVVATPICTAASSHELDVSWSATGLGASISVSIQIADSLKVLAVFETDQPEGTHRFLLDRPAGGPVTVTIRITDSTGTTMEAKSITLSPC